MFNPPAIFVGTSDYVLVIFADGPVLQAGAFQSKELLFFQICPRSPHVYLGNVFLQPTDPSRPIPLLSAPSLDGYAPTSYLTILLW